jgi:dipeptidyl-peptidase-4
MKRVNIFSMALVLVALTVTSSLAQQTGLDLYNAMGERGFVGMEGSPRLNWLPADMGYMESEQNSAGVTEFYRVNPANGRRSPLFSDAQKQAIISGYNQATGETVNGLPFSQFRFVMDNKAIFFTVKDIDYVFNLDTRVLRQLYKPEVERAPYTDELMRNMQASQLWNGTYSHDFSTFTYVKGYDLFTVNTQTREEKQITFDGSEERMNGRPSWVYPEEFSQREAYWYSPDNSKIAYLQYNETDVHQYPVIHELTFETGLELMRYPKAGETNPTLKLFIVDLNSGDRVEVPTNSNSETYIVRPIWRRDGSELTFRRMNRQQNHIELLAYSLANNSVRTILEEREDAYINLHDNFIQLNDNQTFIWTSEVSGYNHIYHYSFDGRMIAQLTSGEKPVSSIINVDEKGKKVYFTANENQGMETYFYVVDMNGRNLKKMTEQPGSHSISMNEAASFYVDMHSSFDAAPSATLYRANGRVVRELMTSDTSNVVAHGLQKPEVMSFKAADGVTDLTALVYKPVDFDPTKKYPVLLPLYGGPEGMDANNSYKNADAYQRMAQLGFIVVRTNYRGGGNRGKAFATMHYKKLGTYEIDDYAQAIKEVTKRDYADGSRVGVYGHSYGGYATAMLMLRYPDLFQAGVSGAPVTDWRSYDTIYTERYMDTPQNNLSGYDEGSAMKYADNLKGKLLIVHGTIDNNVHPQNSIMLIDALVKADKMFDVMFYPDNRHGIRGAHGQHYNKIRMHYFMKHLQPEHGEAFMQANAWK